MLETNANGLELPRVVAVTAKKNLVRLHWSASANAKQVLEALAKDAILTHSVEIGKEGCLHVVLDPTESAAFIAAHPATSEPLHALTVVGYGFGQTAQVPKDLLKALEKVSGIECVGLTCHPQSITVWIKGNNVDEAVREVHARLIS